MNFKDEKGVTGIDITVAIIVITLFVALIATLLTAINTSSSEIGRKTEATEYAISTIEELKAKDWQEVEALENDPNKTGYNGYIDNNSPYLRKIELIDYADIKAEEGETGYKHGLVKLLTVDISYKNGKDTENVTIRTVLTKGG